MNTTPNLATRNTQIIEGFRTGDVKVMLNCYKTIKGRVIKYVLQNSGSEQEAEELAWEALERFRKRCLKAEFNLHDKEGKPIVFERFMYGIYRFAWLDKLKARGNKGIEILVPIVKDEEDDTGSLMATAVSEDTEAIADMQEVLHFVKQAILSLSSQCQQIFTLVCFDNRSHQEVGEELDIKVGTSRKRLKDCRDKLRKILTNSRLFQELQDETLIQNFLIQ